MKFTQSGLLAKDPGQGQGEIKNGLYSRAASTRSCKSVFQSVGHDRKSAELSRSSIADTDTASCKIAAAFTR